MEKEEVEETLNSLNWGKTINLVTTMDKMLAVNSNTQMGLEKTASETTTVIEPPSPVAAAAKLPAAAAVDSLAVVAVLVEVVVKQ